MARFLCEYGGNRPEFLRLVLRVGDAPVWLLSPLPAGTELPFVRDAADWAFMTDFTTRASLLTPITFAGETAGLECFMGAGPFSQANPSPLAEDEKAERKARNLRFIAPVNSLRHGAKSLAWRDTVMSRERALALPGGFLSSSTCASSAQGASPKSGPIGSSASGLRATPWCSGSPVSEPPGRSCQTGWPQWSGRAASSSWL